MVTGWLDEMEAEVVNCVGGRRRITTAELARGLGVSEDSATRLIAMLASAGRLRIDSVSLIATAAASPGAALSLAGA
jgi:hypothetical protein